MAAFDYLPQTRISRVIDPFISGLGRWVSLIWILLLGVIVLNVLMRYAFNEGRIELEELQWHLYSIGFLLGLSYAYQADTHIRVDVVHERLGPHIQAWIELYGIILFLLPLIALILFFSAPFVMSSYTLHEVSQAPGGLPLRWVIKAFLPVSFVFLLLAVIARLSRVWAFLFFHMTAEDQSQNGS